MCVAGEVQDTSSHPRHVTLRLRSAKHSGSPLLLGGLDVSHLVGAELLESACPPQQLLADARHCHGCRDSRVHVLTGYGVRRCCLAQLV